MKIMIVTPYFYPKVGGLENYALNIAQGLKQEGHDVFVVTSNHQEKSYINEVVEGLRVMRLPITFKFSNTPFGLGWYRSIKKIIKEEKPDVINAHTPVPFMADLAIRAAYSIRTPSALTYHNDLAKSSLIGNLLAKLFYLLFSRKTLRIADTIIATSQYYVDNSPYLKKYIDKIQIIPPGVDLNRFNSTVDKNWLKKQFPKKKIVLFVGNLDKTHAHKGMSVLIEAVSIIKKQVPNIHIVAAGKGDAIPSYTSQAKAKGMGENITFSGFVDDDDLPKYYAGADVFVLPSTNESEGFGMVLAEAQACGTPVIGTNVGGIPFALNYGKSGKLVAPNNANELAEAILELLTNKAVSRKLSLTGEAYINDKFGWDVLFDLYQEALLNTYKPRIVQVIAHYPPYVGGMELRVRDLSTRLASRGYRITVLTSDQRSYAHTEEYENLTVNYLKSIEILQTPIIPQLFLCLIRQPKHCIVHLHVAQALIPEIVYLACKIRRVPYIAHIRLDVPVSSRIGRIILPLYKQTIFRHAIRSASKVIVLTPDYAELMINKYNVSREKISIIPNGTDFSVAEMPKNLIPNRPIQLLFVGRLSLQKNIPLLLDAIKILKSKGLKFVLNIVGDGELKDELISHTEKNELKQHVIFHGNMHGEILEKAYEAADIFILTSKAESFGTVLIEAMSKGLPIICCRIPAVRNIVAHRVNGFLVDEDSNELAKAIIDLIKCPEIYKSISMNNIKNSKNYNWARVISKTELEYKALR